MTMQSATKAIPKALIYEMDNGKPIYYKGYREVLNGTKNIEEIMGDSNLQAWLKLKIGIELSLLLAGRKYDLTAGEQGLYLGKKALRSADIAIFRFEDLVLNKHYSKVPPVVAIEIDTKADFEGMGNTIEYYEKKNASLLEFGVQKIIWIFTDSQTVKVVSPGQMAQTFEWSDDVPVIEEVKLNINGIFKKYNRLNLEGLD